MKYLIFFLCFYLTAAGFAQTKAPAIQWSKCFGGIDDETALAIEQTADKGFIIAGESYSTDGDVTGHDTVNENEDYWIVKLDSTGKLEWEQTYGGDGDDVARSIKQTSDGGYIIVGYSNSTNGDVTGNHGGNDYWIVKLDNSGKIQWEKSYGGNGEDIASAIDLCADCGYIITGYTSSDDGDVSGLHGHDGFSDYWVVKIDSVGNLLWQKTLGGINREEAYSVRTTYDHGFVVCGYSGSNDGDVSGNHGQTDYWIVKLDSAGNTQWQKSYGGSYEDKAYDINLTRDKGYIITGRTSSSDGQVTGGPPFDREDGWIIKIDSNGNLEWQKDVRSNFEGETMNSVIQTFDGGYFSFGDAQGQNEDYWLVKLDSLGNLEWQKTLGGSGDEYGFCVRQTSDSGFVIAGSGDSDDGDLINAGHHFHEDYWIVKLGNHPVNVVYSRDTKNTLSICYPNPFSTQTEIEFGTIVTSPSELVIYNILGMELRRMKVAEAAENMIVHRGSLPAGMYIYHRLANGMIIEQGRMIVE